MKLKNKDQVYDIHPQKDPKIYRSNQISKPPERFKSNQIESNSPSYWDAIQIRGIFDLQRTRTTTKDWRGGRGDTSRGRSRRSARR